MLDCGCRQNQQKCTADTYTPTAASCNSRGLHIKKARMRAAWPLLASLSHASACQPYQILTHCCLACADVPLQFSAAPKFTGFAGYWAKDADRSSVGQPIDALMKNGMIAEKVHNSIPGMLVSYHCGGTLLLQHSFVSASNSCW